jgi:hypothetical protein
MTFEDPYAPPRAPDPLERSVDARDARPRAWARTIGLVAIGWGVCIAIVAVLGRLPTVRLLAAEVGIGVLFMLAGARLRSLQRRGVSDLAFAAIAQLFLDAYRTVPKPVPTGIALAAVSIGLALTVLPKLAVFGASVWYLSVGDGRHSLKEATGQGGPRQSLPRPTGPELALVIGALLVLLSPRLLGHLFAAVVQR